MKIPTLIALALLPLAGWAGEQTLAERFCNPPHEAKPWVFWYWIKGNVSREGVDADLEAMAKAGIAGAHLMHIGDSFIEIEVTNLWPNRMIGDERIYPPDTKFMTRTGYAGGGIAERPEWLLKNQPRPTGRITFSTWKHWNAGDELLPSGLLGPVRLQQMKDTK
jgi:hypothetical protein